MNPDSMLILLLMITFLTVFIFIICFFLIYRFLRLSSTGLTELKFRFPVTYPPEGETYVRQTIHIGGLYYRNCVRITISPGGLYISVSTPFPWSKGERTMIPWNMLSRDGEDRIFLLKTTRLKIADEGSIVISIPDRIGNKLPIE